MTIDEPSTSTRSYRVYFSTYYDSLESRVRLATREAAFKYRDLFLARTGLTEAEILESDDRPTHTVVGYLNDSDEPRYAVINIESLMGATRNFDY